MQKTLLVKFGFIALLSFLLLIPLSLIQGMVSERAANREAVRQDIARSSSYAQRITGPILVQPYVRRVEETRFAADGITQVKTEKDVRGQLYFLPEDLQLKGQLASEVRWRGIYPARLFHAKNQLQAKFHIPSHFGIAEDFERYRFEPAFVSLGIADIRGIEAVPGLKLDGKALELRPGSRVRFIESGIHSPIGLLAPDRDSHMALDLSLALQGTEGFSLVPVGKNSDFRLSSDWPHPSFQGEFLPVDRKVDAQGFEAHWQTSFFATNLEEKLKACARDGEQCPAFHGTQMGVDLVDPVDQYLQTERSVKYGLLFVVLSFAGFFLFEILKPVAVHPVQYGLVGLALALFFLLLLSLSEHLAFWQAYGIAAGACIALISFYVSHVLGGRARGLACGLGLSLLYGMLFCLLRSEDHALLLGSALLFAVLAGVMILTRRLNWYRLGGQTPALCD
ncbi:MAG: cell envelope integrity protein CreD [Gammaproteobacteria bacterium]|nr:cell envelope integrity protein CreD [Gammaproteobacteria bacterium]